MGWDGTKTGNGGTTHVAVSEATISSSKESFVSILRDEYIPVGYNLTEEVTDPDTGITSKVTTFHQTSTVRVCCKVKTTVTTVEERGLTEDAAKNHAWFGDVEDSRYGARWTNGSAWCECPNCIGDVVRVAAHRGNDADGWIVTKTTTNTVKA